MGHGVLEKALTKTYQHVLLPKFTEARYPCH